ncbi:hypothetical protein D8S93_24550 [Vibrio sp. VGrn 2]|uniref:putative phage abortive infection protein n=1 Tax=Vibrio sp. VGrn 2 TaxID=2419839 RepID=UPI00128BEC0C|nr:putative phage abortive infection protein [Vibrio sp. VGrn 2]MPS41731.1 hypothetical protein [Vibrio sp. VGrn 2]
MNFDKKQVRTKLNNLILSFRKIERWLFKSFESVVGKTEDHTSKNLYVIFFFGLVVSVSLFLLNIVLRVFTDWKLGEFGDFFGGVLNPILTFLMFIGLIITIIVQKTELALARNEFNRTANALVEQSESSKTQSIETTFFNLLKIHLDSIESLKFNNSALCCIINEKNDSSSGRAVFSSILKWMDKDDPNTTYSSFQETENHIVGHYFRGLYQILSFIDSCELTDSEKEKYSRIVRAQLSTDELAVLYFNCICEKVDSGQFRRLLIKFKILEHLKISKESWQEHFMISSQVMYTCKEDLLKYIVFGEDQKVELSAFGDNAVAQAELYT